jgi:endoglucanase
MNARLLTFCFLMLALPAPAQRQGAFDMNARLGRGINMGNAFEAPDENAWGNPWKPEYFEMMADLGFQHVRLPVRWEPEARSLATAPWTINPDFMARIQEVVDKALAEELIIIVNMHHHELLFEDPDDQKERFLSQWYQIADHFKDYPPELIFEVLNEPHGNLTPEKWNVFFADALAEVRKTNPTRVVLMGTADYGGLGGLAYLEPPDDENVIVSVHYYNPFNFTHQGAEWVGSQADAWLGTQWRDTEAERETVAGEFAAAFAFSQQHDVPIHVGEFGAYSKADLDSRVRWTTFLGRWFEEQELSWAYWEFSAGFGIYNPSTRQFLEPLVDALLHNDMPEPTAVDSKIIYRSNFSSGTDGWNLSSQGGASSTLSASNGLLNINITTGGTESWHVQLTRPNMALHQGRMYRLSVKAKATASRSATLYAGRNSDPWTSYSGYSGITLSASVQSYSVTFTMNNPTDLQARLVMDLGRSTEDVEITEVMLEELNLVVTSLPPDETGEIRFYPNPASTHLHIVQKGEYDHITFTDLCGRKLGSHPLHKGESVIGLERLVPGPYLIGMQGPGGASRQYVLLVR